MNLRGFLKPQESDLPFLKRARKPRKLRGARAFLANNLQSGSVSTALLFETTIPDTAPSLNALLRMHWATRSKVATRWQWNVLSARPATFKYHVPSRVTITRFSAKLLDTDNLYGSCKIIVDALKAAALIQDDAPSKLDLICLQEQTRKKAHTKITIEAINAIRADDDLRRDMP